MSKAESRTSVQLEVAEVLNRFQRLEFHLRGKPGPLSHESSQGKVYLKAIEGLGDCWSHKLSAIKWLHEMGKPFQSELRNGDLMAKLILAH